MHGIAAEGSGLSVLRTFRLLRILKLVRFLPNLRRQLVVMLRTMDNVAVFFGLLMLFIFIFRYMLCFINIFDYMRWIFIAILLKRYYLHICYCFFSILGMNLFGCKFRKTEIINGKEVEIRARKNFDSLLWATVTVFQVRSRTLWSCNSSHFILEKVNSSTFDVMGGRSFAISLLPKIVHVNLNL